MIRGRLAKALVLLLAAVAGTAAQTPRVRDINLYGLGRLPAERVLRAAQARPGEPLPASKGDLEDRIAEVSGVAQARVEAVCCEGPDVLLFIGVEERGGRHVAFRSEPDGHVSLPEELAVGYREVLARAR